jgi:RHS repeat-associated protein
MVILIQAMSGLISFSLAPLKSRFAWQRCPSKYLAIGVSRNSTGNLPTDKLFTGQRLDSTGLYYYGARYYDPSIGRFISPDTIVPNPNNPQTLNRYSYCCNNPLKYIDPSGHELKVVDSGTNYYGETTYSIYDGDKYVGGGTGWEGVRSVYDVYCSVNDLSNGCTLSYNYESDHGTYPVQLVSKNGNVGGMLNNNGIRGLSLNTNSPGEGIYIVWDDIDKSDLNSVMKPLLDHESQHYYEQGIAGFGPWTAAYYGEIGVKWAWYGGNYWETTYNMNSFEIRARTSAGDPTYIYPVPATHWWDSSWGKCKKSLQVFDTWMASPL